MCGSACVIQWMWPIRVQLGGVGPLLLPCGAWGLNASCQTWQQAPITAEPSHWPLGLFYIGRYYSVTDRQEGREAITAGEGNWMSMNPEILLLRLIFSCTFKTWRCALFHILINLYVKKYRKIKPSGLTKNPYECNHFNSTQWSMFSYMTPEVTPQEASLCAQILRASPVHLLAKSYVSWHTFQLI